MPGGTLLEMFGIPRSDHAEESSIEYPARHRNSLVLIQSWRSSGLEILQWTLVRPKPSPSFRDCLMSSSQSWLMSSIVAFRLGMPFSIAPKIPVGGQLAGGESDCLVCRSHLTRKRLGGRREGARGGTPKLLAGA